MFNGKNWFGKARVSTGQGVLWARVQRAFRSFFQPGVKTLARVVSQETTGLGWLAGSLRKRGQGTRDRSHLMSPLVSRMEGLEPRQLMSTVNWTGAGDGTNWTNAANWSTGTVPGATDDVNINNATGPTINFNSPSLTINSLQTNEPISIAAGDLKVNSTVNTSATLTVAGGTLSTATVTTTGSGSLALASGTLDGITLASGTISTTANSYGYVINGLTLNGTLNLGATNGSNYGRLYFSGSETLAGSGSVVFGADVNNAIYAQDSGSPATLTLSAGLTLHGSSGQITSYNPDATIINHATISADTASGTIAINNAGTFTNSGALSASNGGTLSLSGLWSNTGTLTENASTLNLGGSFTTADVSGLSASSGTVNLSGTLNNTGSTLDFTTTTGSWNLLGGTILGGSVASAGSAALILTSNGGTLNGVTIGPGSPLDGTRVSSANATIVNGLTLNGDLYLGNGADTTFGILYFSGSQTLGGVGRVIFNKNASDTLYVEDAGSPATLTIASGITIQGASGSVRTYNVDGSIINYGIIAANGAAGTFVVGGAQSFTNYGHVLVSNADSLTINGAWSNSGSINESNATLNLGGTTNTSGLGTITRTGGSINVTGSIDNTGQTLVLNATTGSWNLLGGSITNGALAGSNGDALVLTSTGGSLTAVALSNGVAIDGAQNWDGYVNVYGGLTLYGTLNLGADSSTYGRLYFIGTQTLGGAGTIVFGSYSGNSIFVQDLAAAPATLTITSNMNIQGISGTISANSSDASIVNQGTIAANYFGGQFSLGSSGGTFTNQGHITVSSGAELAIYNAWTNSGSMSETGGTFDLYGTFSTSDLVTLTSTGGAVNIRGTMNNASQTLTLNSTIGSLILYGGTISGGTIAAFNGDALILTNQGGTLDGVTLASGSPVDATLVNNANASVTNGLTVNGTLALGSANGSTYGRLYFSDSQTLGGTGSVLLGASTNSGLYNADGLSSSTLTIGSGLTIDGNSGSIINQNSDAYIVNNGTIAANAFNGNFAILNGNGSFTNNGTIWATNGSILTIQGAWSNTGTINENNSTLNLGGTFTTSGIGTINRTAGVINVTGKLDNTAATLTLTSGLGAWDLLGGTITNGHIAASGGTLVLTNSGGTLDGVTIDSGSPIDAASFNNANVSIIDGITLNATILLGSSTNYGRLYFSGTQTLQGTGTITFGTSGNNGIYLQDGTGPASLLISTGITIDGANGVIYNQSSDAMITDAGVISADSAGTITIGNVGTFVNSGTLNAQGGSTITLNSNWSDSATINVLAGGTLNLGGKFSTAGLGTINSAGIVNLTGTLDNTSSTLTLTTPWIVLGGTINGGNISAGAGNLILTNSGGNLNAVTIPAGTTIDASKYGNAFATFFNGLTLNGSIQLGSTDGGTYGRLYFSDSQPLSGSGTLTFGGSANNGIYAQDGVSPATLTLGASITINGNNGAIAGYNSDAAVINDGAINLTVSGGTLNFATAGNFTNNGTINGLAGGVLNFNNAWSNHGTINVLNTTLNLGGTFATSDLGTIVRSGGAVNLIGTLNNASSTLTLDSATGSWNLPGGIVNGGTINGISGLSLILINGTLNSVTVDGSGIDASAVSGYATIVNGLTVNGIVNLGASDGRTYGRLYFVGSQTLGGIGEIVLGNNSNNAIYAQDSTVPAVLTLGDKIEILANAGSVATYNGDASIINNGIIDANLSTGTVNVTGTFFNNGVLATENTGTLKVNSVATGTLPATTTALTFSANPVTAGTSVTLTASISTASLTPTGIVIFRDNGIFLGSASVVSNVATFSTASLSVGAHPFTATYSGDTNVNSSVSASVNLGVNTAAGKLTTATALSANINVAPLGTLFHFNAAVAAGASVPTGEGIAFFDGSNSIGTGILNSFGSVAFNTSSFTIGTHLISASYNGDANFAASLSAVSTVVVTQAITGTTLYISPYSTTFANTVTLSASVSSVGGPVSGFVDFTDGTIDLGSVSLVGGLATISTTSLSIGNHTLVASYLGTPTFGTSAGTNSISISPSSPATTTALYSDLSNVNFGQTVTFTASVVTVGGTPQGTVSFYNGSSFLGSSQVNPAGIANLATSGLPAGTGSITASYASSNLFTNSDSTANPLLVTIQKIAPTTQINATATTLNYGTGVTLYGNVQTTTGAPSGYVAFVEGATTLGTAGVYSGIATSPTLYNLAAGTHLITANYLGDSTFIPASSSPITLVVNAAQTGVNFSSSTGSPIFGQTVSLNANVYNPYSTPVGSVAFIDGGITLGTVPVDGSGNATFNTAALAAGQHVITLQYTPGNSNYVASSSIPSNLYVSRATPNASLTSSSPAPTFDDLVVFTASISSTVGSPGGNVIFRDGTTVLGASNVNSGVATLQVSTLNASTHAITAIYSGDASFQPGVLTIASLPVSQYPATTSVNFSSNPASALSPVTISASVSYASSTPSGTVIFTDSGTTLGSALVLVNGAVSLTISSLTPGTHSIVASYSGDSNFASNASSASSLVVNKSSTTTSPVTVDVNPSTFGQTVTLTTSVTSTNGTPSGTVTFYEDGSISLGTGSLDPFGAATLKTAALLAGGRSLTATYNADPNFDVSTSSANGTYVYQAATSVTIVDSGDIIYGQTVTFTSSVTSTGGNPTGDVVFTEYGSSLGSGHLVNGVATWSTSTLNAGTHNIYAIYNGDTNFLWNETSPTVLAIAQTANITATLNVSTLAADDLTTITYSATVTSPIGTPGNGVYFYESGSNYLGYGTLVNGVATMSETLYAGTHVITAFYQGDNNFLTTTSNAQTIVTVKATTSTSIEEFTSTADALQPVTFVSSVTAASGTPSGYVTFYADGTVNLGSNYLTLGVTTFSTSTYSYASIAVGSHNITAVYSGDSTYDISTSTTPTAVTILQVPVTTTLTVDSPTPTFGDTVTFTVSIGSRDGIPSGGGFISLTSDGGYLSSGGVDPTTGLFTAVINTYYMGAGTHAISATFSNQPNYIDSTSNTINYVIAQVPTSVTEITSPSPAVFGQSITLTASVAASYALYGGLLVSFYDGTTKLDSEYVDPATDLAICHPTNFAPGTHSISVIFNGDNNFAPSASTTSDLIVSKVTTSTSLLAPFTAIALQPVTFVATVSSNSITPNNPVYFFDGTTTLGWSYLNPVDNTGTFTTSSLATGTHTITAQYFDDANFIGSISTTSNLLIRANTLTSVTISPPSSVGQQSVTFFGTVSAPSGTPSGNVLFLLNNGTNTLGTGTLNLGAIDVATFTTNSLLPSTYSVIAVYLGDANDGTSVSDPSTLTVSVAPTTTTLSIDVPSPTAYQSVNLTASVSAITGTPTGSVTFTQGATTLGIVSLTAGVAILPTSALPAGSETSITATYSTDLYFGVSSNSILVNVGKSDTTTSVSNNPVSPLVLQNVILTASVTTSASHVPSGQVDFYDNGVSIGFGTVGLTGLATFNTTGLSYGNHPITATYVGDLNFNTSAGTGSTIFVDKNPDTVFLDTPAVPDFGSTVTFTTTVQATQSGLPDPTGTVTFTIDDSQIVTASLVGTVATFSTANLSAGSHSVVVNYFGDDANFAPGTSNTISLTVNQASTSSSVGVPITPQFGSTVALTATVTSTAGLPFGSVTFFDNGNSLGTASITQSDGTATFNTASLSLGTHSITVQYNADGNFNYATSQSGRSSLVVVSADTTTTYAPDIANPIFGDTVTLFATVASTTGPIPTGQVVFFETTTAGLSTLGTGSLTLGVGTFVTNTLTAGTHSIYASYVPDSGFNSSDSLPTSDIVVAKATPTVTSAPSLSNSVFGQSVDLTATVSYIPPVIVIGPGPGGNPGVASPSDQTLVLALPGGTVTFFDGTVSIGTADLVNGTATLALATLSIGTHQISSTYAGDPNYQSAVDSGSNTLTVGQASTTTTLGSFSPTVYGQTDTFTATVAPVAPGTGTPSGFVTFFDGTTSLGTSDLVASVATFFDASLNVGSHFITAVYSSDTQFAASGSAAQNQIVTSSTSSTTLDPVSDAQLFQTVTFTATVTTSTSPIGHVNFLEGGITIGSGDLVGNVATFRTSALSLGTHTITAEFPGDINFGLSDSLPVTLNITSATTSTSLNVLPSSQNVLGSVTLSANVTDAGGPVSGTVNFMNGSTLIDSETLDGSGSATFTTTLLHAGTYSITAQYLGTPSDQASISLASSLVVSPIDSATTLNVLPPKASYGDNLVLSANVIPLPPVQGLNVPASVPVGSGVFGTGVPSRFVTFMDGTTSLGTADVDASGNATLQISTLLAGGHSFTAVYSGDSDYNSSQITTSFIIDQISTSAAVNFVPPVFGQTVAISATVTPVSSGQLAPIGTVDVWDNSVDTDLGSGSIGSDGTFTVLVSGLTVGTHNITASYGGDQNYVSSSMTLDLVVSKASTSTTLTLPTIAFGQTATFQASVSPIAPGAGSPAGSVLFLDGSTTLGSSSLVGGVATLSAPGLAGGSHTITAVYSGDPHFQANSNSAVQFVGPAVSGTHLTLPGNINVGQPATFVFTVSTTGPIPTGVVTFLDGTTTLGTATLSTSTLTPGVASFTASNLSGGSHSISAVYSGDANFQPNTNSGTQTVIKATVATHLTTTNIDFGHTSRFTFTVTGTVALGTPTGIATFYDGTTSIGTGTLTNGSTTFIASNLSAATHTITATYDGDSNYDVSSIEGFVIVNPVNSASVLTVQNINLGQVETFTASVTILQPGAGIPVGTVYFLEGATTLGSATLVGGFATFSTSTLAAGAHSITLNYAGNSDVGASSDTQSLIVTNTNPSIDLTVVNSVFGHTATYLFTAFPPAGTGPASGTVTFLDGSSTLGVRSLNASSAASFSTATLGAGTHTIRAVYSGDTHNQGGTATGTAIVTQATTTTGVSNVPGSFVTATVTPTTQINWIPSGTVQFFADGTTSLGSGTLDATGTATLSRSALPHGTHAITAVYLGDTNDLNSASSPITVAINTVASAIEFQLNSNHVALGDPIVITVTVSAAVNPLSGTAPIPSGTVTLMNGTTTIGVARLNNLGVAVFQTGSLKIQTLNVTASYSGDAAYDPSIHAIPIVTGSVNERYVNQLYRDILGRDADGAGLAGWSAAIAAGASYSDVANAISHSRELDATYVQGLYQKYLGRTVDSAGLVAWVDSLRSGTSNEAIRAGILASDEYFHKVGGTNVDYVFALYKTYLGRSPDASGKAYWVGQIATQGRFNVAMGIASSQESLNDIVTGYYQTLLHRAPDADGLAAWTSQLAAGVPEANIIASLASSTEYFTINNIA